MKSNLFSLNLNDFYKGLITSILTGIVAVLYGTVIQTGFDVFATDWQAIGNLVINSVIVSFVGYLSKNFISDSEGKVLGKI